MHLRFVEAFCDVVQQRSFSKAAIVNGISQSAVSQAVNLLERQLGTLLIDRSKRPFELTPAGQVYFDGCREMLENYRAIEDRVLRIRDKVVGTLRVAAIYSVGLLQMDSYVKRFGELFPDVKLRVEYLHPERVYEQVAHDEAELGLVSFPRDRGEFTSLPWQEQPMVLVVSPGHRLAVRKSISAREIDGEDYIGFTQELSIRKEIDRWFKRSKVTVKIEHEFDNIENIKRAIEVGSAVAVLPLPTVRREAEGGSLAVVPFSDVNWMRPLGIVHKRQKTLSSATQKFIEMLRQDPKTFHNGEHTPHQLGLNDQAFSAHSGVSIAATRDANGREPSANGSAPVHGNNRSNGSAENRVNGHDENRVNGHDTFARSGPAGNTSKLTSRHIADKPKRKRLKK